mmetsp:Transcript_1970/g.3457  ORF Transcript_1970/g.3457 Transcript_1970/m.3457 type:complete len:217 (-) Transcript_1970:709-1359(-)
MLEAVELGDLDLEDDAPQLLEDHLHALEAGLLEALDLLLGEDLEGDLGHQQVGFEAAGVADGGLDVVVGEGVEGVHVLDGLRVDVVEDEVEAAAALELDGGALDELALDELLELLGVLGDDVEDDDLLAGGLAVDLQLLELLLLLVEQRGDLGADQGQRGLDVPHDDLVQLPAQELHARLRGQRRVVLAQLEEALLGAQGGGDALPVHDVLLGAAD